ncbi:D(2) dopamine receptor-like [Rhopilema esculentum]|uniref:D(2) dopamine receptor-like n=1 Tax=Rhopilema esculentum TaxID=499914 RepID=UPI0031D0C2EF|eukprot:gene8173-14103_t
MAAESTAEAVIKSIFMALFIISALVGNTLVCVAIRKNKRLQTLTNYYVFNLAVADFLYGLTGMPMILITSIAGEWILGDALCQVSGTLTTLFVLVSIWTMCLIGVNRYFAVGRSTSYKSIYKKKRVLMSIGAVWVIATVVSIAPQFGWSSIRQGDNFCTINGKDEISYSIFVILFAYLAPLLVLTCLYTKIFVILRNHEKTMVGMRSGSQRAYSENDGDSIDMSSAYKVEIEKATSLPRDVVFDKTLAQSSPEKQINKYTADQNNTTKNGPVLQNGGEVNSNRDSFADVSTAPANTVEGSATDSVAEEPPAEHGNDIEKFENADGSKLATASGEETPRTASDSGVALMLNNKQGQPTVTYHADVENLNETQQPRKTRTLSGLANALKLRRSRTSKKIRKFKMEARITKMLFVVVAVFFLCWTPLALAAALYAFGAEPKNFNFFSFSFVIASINSICNPIIYAFMNKLFRKAFKNLFTSCRMMNNDSQETS